MIVLTLSACPSASAPHDVGAACSTVAECKDGLLCDIRLPGGVCTRACAAIDDCPPGSRCVELTYTVAGVAMAALACVQECDDPAQCRAAWRCVQASPEPFSVCIPRP